jgi:hypothetical protein
MYEIMNRIMGARWFGILVSGLHGQLSLELRREFSESHSHRLDGLKHSFSMTERLAGLSGAQSDPPGQASASR